MRCEDWRAAGDQEIAPLCAVERERWLSALGWDIGAGLEAAERGRRAGRTPGFVARDTNGRITGWTFFWVDRGTLHLGVLTGDRADVVRALLDEAIESPEAAYARRYQGFLFPSSGMLASALARRRFALSPQVFLSRPVRGPLPVAPPVARPWRDEDLPNLVRLLARAYAGTPTARAFAPEGRLDEWVSYVSQIMRASACGPFLPAASLVVDGDRPDRPMAAVITTATSPDTWHIAQIAVDPSRRRQGLARHLVRQVLGLACLEGIRDVTLVVDEQNLAARALYASLGFLARASLLFAARPRLTRVTTADVAGAAPSRS